MAEYLQELRRSIDDRKKRTAVLKPSAKAAQEQQYGMTDGGGKTRTAASTAVKPTTALTGQQSTAIVKPSVQTAREKQYGMTDGGGKTRTAASTAVQNRTAQTSVIKPASSSTARQTAGMQALEQVLHQPNRIADVTSRDNMNQMAARAALNQDTTTAQAGRTYQQNLIKKQKDNLQAQINGVMAQVEAEADARDNQARLELSQTLSNLRSRMNKLDSKLAELNVDEVADWEDRQYNEIMASGGGGLFIALEKLNGLTDAIIKEAAERGDERRSELTDLEKEYFAKYDELKEKYGDKVDSWLDYIERMKNSKEMDELLKKAQAAAADKPFWTSLGSIGLNALSGGGYVDLVGQKLQRFATDSDTPLDYNSPAQRPARATQAVRGEVSKDMGSVGKFLYNTGMSLGDSAVAIALGKAGLGSFGTVLLGGAAATNATHAAAERGATDGQALLVGLVAGATETLMEKVSIESLFNLKTPGAARGLVYNVLKQAGVEGTEEGLTTIVNTIADGLIMRDKSELETIKRNLMANGASREEAEIAAIQVWSKEFALDVAGGMLSGAAFGTFKSGADYIGTNRLQQNRNAPGNNRSVIQTDHREGTSYGEGVYLRDGGQWTGGQNSGGEVSAVEAGTGRNQSRQAQVKSADSGAAAYSDGQKVSAAELGIRGGSTEANIQIVNSGETMMTRAAMNIAQENGLELTLFAGGNLQINNASGKTDSVRGYIEGNRVYVRADHPVYTAEQLMRHEVGHVQIARGEVDPKTVRQRITKTYGIGHTIRLSMLYAAAYEGSGMTGGEIWEEIICDSLGDMNIFQGYNVEEQAGRLLNEVRENMAAETRMDRGPPAADLDVVGRMSRDNDKRNRALQKGEMVNQFRNKVNWRSYYEKLQLDKYNPDYYDDGEIAYMYLDGYTLTLEMQENGEFSVIGREKGAHHGKSVGNYGSVGKSNESTGISGKRNRDGDRDNRSGRQSTGNSKGSGALGRSGENAERSGEGDAADHSQTDAVEIKGKTSRELDMVHIAALLGNQGTDEEDYLAFIRRLEEAQVMLKAEELRQAYLQNMARLEEVEREAEMDAAFWKGFDR